MKYLKEDLLVKHPPPPGLSTYCQIDRWVDGDTVDVVIARKVRIRLIGIDTDELRDVLGKVEKGVMERIAPPGSEALLFIPAGKDSLSLTDILTLDRVLGHLFVDGENVIVRFVREHEVDQQPAPPDPGADEQKPEVGHSGTG